MRIAIYTVLDILFTLFCIVFVNWWAPLFAGKDGWLPNWLAWVQTFDDTLDAGKRDGLYPKLSPYWARVFWLYRNSAYGFGYWALGMPFNRDEWAVITYIPGDPYNKRRGFTFYAVGPGGAFNWHVVRGPIRFKVGWKAWNLYDPDTHAWKMQPWGPEWRIPFVFSISKAK
jgi:hypothetical protein